MIATLADLVLYPSFVSVLVLLALYVLGQPWWRSWFGRCAALILFTLALVMLRAMLTLWFGADYPGRDLILLLGRLEILAASVIAAGGLVRHLARDWRGAGEPRRPASRTERGPGAPNTPSGVS